MKLFSLLPLLALLAIAQTKQVLKLQEPIVDSMGPAYKNKWSTSGENCLLSRVMTESGQLCHFPFHYGRIIHKSCTRRGKHGPRKWCSLTKNYDQDQRWSYCVETQNIKDHCEDDPCEPRGICENTLKGHRCVCKEPYTGRNCQTDKCYDEKLLKYFEPKEKWLRYSPPIFEECVCSEKGRICKGTTGRECSENPCLNGGSCIQSKKTVVCGCTQGHIGPHCEIRQNEACYTGNGTSYRGTEDVTLTGTPCIHWDSDLILHEVSMYSGPRGKIHGIGSHPYCRSPDGDTQPWCFVMKEERLSWEHCLIPRCNQSTASTSSPTVHESVPPTKEPNPTTSGSDSIINTEAPTVETRGLPLNCAKKFQKTPSITPRIVGGLVAFPASHPYIAALYIGKQFCGGSLISSCWFVTAAHCLEHRPHVKEISVVLGQNLFNVTDRHTVTFSVQKYVLHEMYSPNTFQHDIALVKLQSTSDVCAEVSQFVQFVCLPQNLKMVETAKPCAVVGWGHQYEGADEYSLFLQEAFTPIIPKTLCQAPHVHGDKILSEMMCAGVMEGGVDACQGDSGGPLVCEVDGRIELHGIVSWGTGCGMENKPGVYTAVFHYIEWIRANIS
ncbi:coagulation factor XII [Rhinophrynus dorsalis]